MSVSAYVIIIEWTARKIVIKLILQECASKKIVSLKFTTGFRLCMNVLIAILVGMILI